jgi:rRNA maturation protein Rpf1
MGLKNWSTVISVEKSMMEIERILAKHGATHIFKMYDDKGRPQALAFKSNYHGQEISFKLPMELEKVKMVFKNQASKGNIPKKLWDDEEQARKTGWRIIKDWVDSQMALIEINVVQFEEIFLPYMYDMQTNQTLFEKMEKRGFDLQLEYKKRDG